MELNEIIASNIKQLRKEKNMTQGELGDKIGYSDKTISKWENGDALPDIATLYSLANFFGVTMDYFVHSVEKNKDSFKIDKSKDVNKWIITMLGFSIIWFLVTIMFAYNGYTKLFSHAWLVFVWGIPVSMIELMYCNRKFWNNKIVSVILSSVIAWTTITSIYLHTLFSASGQNVWLLFITGVPLQIMILLWFSIYRK